MSGGNRQPYLTATVLDQAFLDACHDNLTCQLELTVDIQTPSGTIHASDRNKYKGTTFYEALLVFPVIRRTLGDWLSGQLEFSQLELRLSNVDGRFNHILPAGADFDGWIGKTVDVQLGLRDIASTYTSIFHGEVTPVGGFGRDVQAINLVARDTHDIINTLVMPLTVFRREDYPTMEDDNVGKGIPIIYGDWTVNVNAKGASVPGYVVNGLAPFVNGDDIQVIITVGTPAVFTAPLHGLAEGDRVVLSQNGGTLPSGLADGSTYYVRNPTTNTFQLADVSGGTPDSASGTYTGSPSVKPDQTIARPNVKCVISSHALTGLDTSNVFLNRGDSWYHVTENQIVNVAADKSSFEVQQGPPTGTSADPTQNWFDGTPYYFQKGDKFYVRCKGKDISSGAGTYDSNAVQIARDILITFGSVSSGDFDANWDTYRDKSSPAESAIANIGCRVHQTEQHPVLELAASILNQVRLEMFVDRSLKFKINSLQFDSWPVVSGSSFQVKNWDVEHSTFKPTIDTRNNFNRAKAAYNLLPDVGDNAYETDVYRNQAAIDASGRQISKEIVFPNLYVRTDVENQVQEILKLASAYLEVIEVNLTWRALLVDIGDFVSIDVKIGSTQYDGVPAMIREIGYDPNGLKIPVKAWSLQMVPYPGWSPGFSGITGGSTAVITKE